jgi:hypothetical protein
MSGNITNPVTKEDWLEHCWCRDLQPAQTREMLAQYGFNVTDMEILAHNEKSNAEMGNYYAED